MSPVHIADPIVRPAGRQVWPGILLHTVSSPSATVSGISDQPHTDAISTASRLSEEFEDHTGPGGAFLWKDSARTTWMVQVADDEFQHPDRLIFATNYQGCGWVIDSARRGRAIRALEDRIGRCFQPDETQNSVNPAKHTSWTRRLHRLRLVNDAEQILEYLWPRSGGEWGSPVLVSAKELGTALQPVSGGIPRGPTRRPVDDHVKGHDGLWEHSASGRRHESGFSHHPAAHGYYGLRGD